MFLRRKHEEDFDRPPPPGEITLRAIGTVHSAVRQPRPHGWEKVASSIEFLPEHAGRLAGLDRYSHVVVVFYMDLAVNAPEFPERITLESGNAYGIFATRSQLRPNHIGVSVVRLVAVDGTSVELKGLDAVDGTPVLDIKPYLPEYDAVPKAKIPRG